MSNSDNNGHNIWTISNLLSWKNRENPFLNLIRAILWIGLIFLVGLAVNSFEKTKEYSSVLSLTTAALEILIGVFQFYSSKITELLNRQEIVVKIDIQEFDNDHIKVIQELFQQFEQNETINEIFVLDSSHPVQWWSESMLAYLAVQSTWLKNNSNKIHRFFILNESELNTKEAKKIITFHVLMGFNTYLILKSSFNGILTQYNRDKSEQEKVKNKEYFIWNGVDNTVLDTNNNPLNSCNLNSIKKIKNLNKKVVGYQSLWNIDTPYYKRKNGNEFTRMTGKVIDISKWIIKFEFIMPDYLKIRNNYLDFSNHLISLKKDCCVSSAIDDSDKIIHIPKMLDDGTPLDTDTIYEIIESFCKK